MQIHSKLTNIPENVSMFRYTFFSLCNACSSTFHETSSSMYILDRMHAHISLQITCLRFVFYCCRVPLGCFFCLFVFLYLFLMLFKCTRLHIHSFFFFRSLCSLFRSFLNIHVRVTENGERARFYIVCCWWYSGCWNVSLNKNRLNLTSCQRMFDYAHSLLKCVYQSVRADGIAWDAASNELRKFTLNKLWNCKCRRIRTNRLFDLSCFFSSFFFFRSFTYREFVETRTK